MTLGNDAGFTLIESLVALAILAVSAVSLLMATEAYVARIDGLESRALAQLAAENRLAEIELGADPDPTRTPRRACSAAPSGLPRCGRRPKIRSSNGSTSR